MDILAFFGSVWLSIAVGVFFIAMVIGCSFDRSYNEGPKWWVFFIGLGVLAALFWKTHQPEAIPWTSWPFWQPIANVIGIYLLIGLGYSILEFTLEVRKSTRYWGPKWKEFKRLSAVEYRKSYLDASRKAVKEKTVAARIADSARSSFTRQEAAEIEADFDESKIIVPEQTPLEVMKEFVNRQDVGYNRTRRIIGIEINEEQTNIEPKIRKSVLAEHVGVWTIFWPFYLVSLVIGDLLVEVFEWIAEAIAGLSGRFVKMAFRNVFKF